MRPDAIVLSPGPCTPNEAGICLELIAKANGTLPILGVCLGHQAIGQVYGGKVVRAPVPMHGKLSRIHHTGKSVFRGLNNDFMATRYHSLTIAPESMPADLEITAVSEDGVIMGVMHKTPSGPWRAIPSRKHRLGERPCAAAEFPAHGAHVATGMSERRFLRASETRGGGETLDAESSARAFAAIMAGGVGEAQHGRRF